jgi:hypothetical protein
LYDLNVAPSVISEFLKDMNGDDVGTFLPMTLFNRNEKFRELLNMDKGILSSDTDGEKIISILRSEFDTFPLF